MTTHQLNGKELLVVDVPEKAFDIRVINQTLEGWKTTGGIYWYRDLPPGKYSLLLTEEDAKGVVECYNGGSLGSFLYHNYLKPYEDGKQQFYLFAIQSLHSWIKSIGKDPKLVVVLVKNE